MLRINDSVEVKVEMAATFVTMAQFGVFEAQSPSGAFPTVVVICSLSEPRFSDAQVCYIKMQPTVGGIASHDATTSGTRELGQIATKITLMQDVEELKRGRKRREQGRF